MVVFAHRERAAAHVEPVAVMLDFEFIARPPERFEGLLVYRYRTGVLRRQLADVLRTMAQRGGGDLFPVEPTELALHWSAAGLFDGVRLCDVPAAGQRYRLLASRLLDLARVSPPMPTALFSCGNAFDAPGIKNLPLLHVVEPLVSEANLVSIIGFIERTADLTVRPALVPTEAAILYFRELLEGEGGTLDLRAFITEYDRSCILYQDLETGKFNAPTRLQLADEGRSFVVRALRRFISEEGNFTDAGLVRAIAIKARRGWSARELADDLCRATRILIESVGSDKHARNARKYGSMTKRRLYLWAAMLIAQTAKGYAAEDSEFIASVDELMLTIHRLIEQFKVGNRRLESEPLKGCWSLIDRVARSHIANEEVEVEPDARSELIATLRKSLSGASGGGWLGRLNRILSKPAPKLSTRSGQDFAKQQILAKSFTDLLGQERVLSELSRRFAEKDHGKPLVIIGAPGSGKRSVARLYAKALVCEGKKVNGIEPCCRCQSCASFQHDGDFSYIPFDLGLPNALQYAVGYVETLPQSSFARHRTIVLSQPEKSSASLDAFLKPFEDGAHKTTFIVLATDQSALRGATLSRSRAIRLATLNRSDARALVLRTLPKAEFSNEVLDLIIKIGGGVPGRLLQLADIVKASGAYSLSQARVALEVDWGLGALSFWSTIFSGFVNAEAINELTAFCSPQEALTRTARVLICLERSHTEAEPALFGVEAEFAEVERKLLMCAGHREMGRQDLYAGLMNLWCSQEVVEHDDLLNAAQEASEFMRASSGT